MKHILISIVFVLCTACGGGGGSSDSNTQPIQEPANTLKYFGFAVVDCGWDDPHDNQVKTNYIDEVADFSNVAQMCVYSADEYIVDRLTKFNNLGVQAVLYIESILFERIPDSSSPSGSKLSLRNNAEELWGNFVALNEEGLTEQNIVTFYVVDEPVWSGLSSQEFEYALHLVKSTFPSIPTLSIEAHPVVDRIMIPTELDWVGFDRYAADYPDTDEVWLNKLETVRNARSRPDQKLIIIANTQWVPSYESESGLTPEDMEAMIYSYLYVAENDPDVIGLAGFLWPGGLNSSSQLGARNLPVNVQDAFRRIGSEIKNR